MKDEITGRIAGLLGIADLTGLADKLSGADLHSLLLTILKRRIDRLAPSDLGTTGPLSPVGRNCDLDGRLIASLEKVALDSASDFGARELSPVVPLGAVAVLTGLDQGNVLSTIRAFEVASDPTVGLALECARARRKVEDRRKTLRLCTTQRVLRFPQPQNPSFTSHFKLFALVTSGRDRGSFSFECESLVEQIAVYLTFLTRLKESAFDFDYPLVEISDTRLVARLCRHFALDLADVKSQVRARDSASSTRLLTPYEDWPTGLSDLDSSLAPFELPEYLLTHLRILEENVLRQLERYYPQVSFSFNCRRLTGLGYYQGPCFHIKLRLGDETFAIADGGFVDWTRKLLSDSKERLLTSAIGTELLCRKFYTGKQKDSM